MAFAALLTASGCAGVDAIPGVASEEDIIVATAYDYLSEAGVVSSADQYRARVYTIAEDVFPVYDPAGPPGNAYDSPPTPWSEQWSVKFDLFDAFGEPVGEVAVRVRRYDDAEGAWYVVEP